MMRWVCDSCHHYGGMSTRCMCLCHPNMDAACRCERRYTKSYHSPDCPAWIGTKTYLYA